MAYSKTNWVNNTTPINETNLNKIEQGIYDNSLVVDAVTNTLNPTDTETYKTAELTEGQITDVIGVNDILIKGQTSQNGEPTPSSPVDVNVVSGSNVVSTSNKNLFNAQIQAGTYNQATYSVARDGLITQSASDNSSWSTTQPRNFYLDAGTYTINCIGKGTEKRLQIRNVTDNVDIIVTQSEKGTFTLTERKLLAIKTWGNSTYPASYYIQIEKGSEATTYEQHQGKELPLDLGNIELCKIGDYQDYIYKKDNKWYKHKAINKNTLNGNEKWHFGRTKTNYTIFFTSNFQNDIKIAANNNINSNTLIYCDKFSNNTTANQQWANDTMSSVTINDGKNITFNIPNSIATTTDEVETYLISNNITLYYVLATPIEEEITDTTLITQLEAIYNAPLYEETNITQTNNDLPMVLDITACKDNIKGIKAFIRK